MNSALDTSKTRKLILQTLTGAAVGATSAYLFLEFGGGAADFDDPARLAAAAAGLIYALIGLFVGIGALAPNAGAVFLNVEDADEIVEERAKIGPAALACVLTGMLLIALALTPGGDRPGALSRDAAAIVAALSFAGLIALSLWMRSRVDEFNRQLGTEASALAMYVSLWLLGGWAALAHLGLVEWIAPLGLLAAFALVELGAIFWVVGRRGLLAPR